MGTLPHEGPLARADAVGESGSMDSGPGVRIHLRLAADGRLGDAAFEALGMPGLREAASALCAALCGAPVEAARDVSAEDVALLAAVPPGGAAPRLVYFAKSAALRLLLRRPEFACLHTTCTCFSVDEESIRRAVRERGVSTVAALQVLLPVCRGCGTCRPDVERIIADERGRRG